MNNLFKGFQMKLINKQKDNNETTYLFNNGYGAVVKEDGECFNISLIQFNMDLKNNKYIGEPATNTIIPCITTSISYNELVDLLDDISILSHRDYMR